MRLPRHTLPRGKRYKPCGSAEKKVVPVQPAKQSRQCLSEWRKATSGAAFLLAAPVRAISYEFSFRTRLPVVERTSTAEGCTSTKNARSRVMFGELRMPVANVCSFATTIFQLRPKFLGMPLPRLRFIGMGA